MREEQSDRILLLAQSAAQVETEIETHHEEIGARLHEEFAPLFAPPEEGQQTPDFRAHLLALKAKLSDSREKLIRAEELHIDLVRQAVELRNEREELNASLYEDFSSMRRTVEELYRGKGKKNANAFILAGIQGPTAQRPTKLLRQIDLATLHLRKPGLVFPPSRFDGTRLKPRNLAKVLAPRAKRLSEVQGGLSKVASEMNASRKEKKRAIEAHQNVFSWVAQGAESLFHLAGEHELAERVRPSLRRRGRRAVEVREGQEGESEAGASPDEGSSEAASGDGASGETPAGDTRPAAQPAANPAAESAQPSSANG